MSRADANIVGWIVLVAMVLALLDVTDAFGNFFNVYPEWDEDDSPALVAYDPTQVPPTATATTVPTSTATAEPTATATPTPTETQVPTEAPTETPEPTETPVPTETATIVPTETPEPTATTEPTATAIATEVPTSTPTATPEPTATPTLEPCRIVEATDIVPTDTELQGQGWLVVLWQGRGLTEPLRADEFVSIKYDRDIQGTAFAVALACSRDEAKELFPAGSTWIPADEVLKLEGEDELDEAA